MRGVKLDLLDATLYSDNINHGPGQMIPAARRLYYSCILTA